MFTESDNLRKTEISILLLPYLHKNSNDNQRPILAPLHPTMKTKCDYTGKKLFDDNRGFPNCLPAIQPLVSGLMFHSVQHNRYLSLQLIKYPKIS